MVQIVQGKEGIGSLLGRHLGAGISQGLETLAQNKLQDILRQQEASRITPGLTALGIPPQEAQQIAMLPESLQSLVLKNYLNASENAGLDQALQQLSGETLPTQSELPLEILQQAPQQKPLNLAPNLQDIIQQVQGRQQAPAQEQAIEERRAPAQERAPSNLAELLRRPRLSPEHKLKVAGLQQQRQMHQEKLSAKEQERVDAETKPYYDEISKVAQGAKDSKIRLDRMRHLIAGGRLRGGFTSAIVNLIGKIGFDISSLEGADTQEFRKLSNDFIKNAKNFFGSRITDRDLDAFLKTIPNVTQSDEAKIRVIDNLESFDKIALLKKKAADEIIARNGGKRPRNISELVDKAISPEVDKIAEEFRTRI